MFFVLRGLFGGRVGHGLLGLGEVLLLLVHGTLHPPDTTNSDTGSLDLWEKKMNKGLKKKKNEINQQNHLNK